MVQNVANGHCDGEVVLPRGVGICEEPTWARRSAERRRWRSSPAPNILPRTIAFLAAETPGPSNSQVHVIKRRSASCIAAQDLLCGYWIRIEQAVRGLDQTRA